jgi:endonuclease/exonuclease/phosphatase family metal-dependent hydrolase
LTGPPSLRLLTWNVRDLRGDQPAVVRVIRSADADLVCLQEAPRWPGSRWRLAALARSAGLLYVAGGRDSAGTALLCSLRTRVDDARCLRLPVRDGARLLELPPPRPRGAVLATVRLPGGTSFALACVHLGLQQAQRLDHARRLHRLLVAGGLPAVVAGDLNEPPDGPSWRLLADLAADPWPASGPTFPSWRPHRRIDAVLVGPGLSATVAGWEPSPDDVRRGSDHLPVLAELDIRRSASAWES